MGGVGIYSPHPKNDGGAGGTGDCCTFIENDAALEALWPNVAGVHTVAADGCYCFGSFDLTVGRRIAVPAGRRCRFTGGFEGSRLTASVAAANITVAATAEFSLDNIKVRNINGTAASRAITTSTSECYLNQCALFSTNGFDLDILAGKVDATQVRMTDAAVAVRLLDGEFFGTGLDVESVTNVGQIDGGEAFMVQGSRFSAVTTCFVQNGTLTQWFSTDSCYAKNVTTWFFRNAGTLPPFLNISLTRANNLTNQLFNPNGAVPTSMTTIYRNSINGPAPTLFAGGFSTASANARVRANSVNNVLQAEV